MVYSLALRIREELDEAKREGIQKGILETKVNDIIELLEEYGEVSDVLRSKIAGQNDILLLSKWHKIAARVNSINEFEEKRM